MHRPLISPRFRTGLCTGECPSRRIQVTLSVLDMISHPDARATEDGCIARAQAGNALAVSIACDDHGVQGRRPADDNLKPLSDHLCWITE